MIASGLPDDCVLQSTGNTGDRMLWLQPVVAEHVGPVVPHVVDVRNPQYAGERGPEEARLLMGVHDVVAAPAAHGLLQGSDGDRSVEEKLAERWSDRYGVDAGHVGSEIAEAGDFAVLPDRIGHEIDLVPQSAERQRPVEDADRGAAWRVHGMG